jgi:hypothetical protein
MLVTKAQLDIVYAVPVVPGVKKLAHGMTLSLRQNMACFLYGYIVICIK